MSHNKRNVEKSIHATESPDLERGKFHHHSGNPDWAAVLQLAFQSIGVVYGDIGTSPLYVMTTVFSNGIKHEDDVVGVLSIILYTITLIVVVKYVFIVLRANHNGHGGTFALYSLICRCAKVGLIPHHHVEDEAASTLNFDLPDCRASKVRSSLENSNFAKYVLLFATMLGTAMLIGDGVLTPCISVLSAVGGIKGATTPALTDEIVVWISVAILVLLFCFQRLGTDRVGYIFAPILSVWFAFISGIGVYNFFKYDPTVAKAINPRYILDYFKRDKKQAWVSLGGTVLSITGAEALFADVGQFSVKSIQLSTCCLIYPSLILAYEGQAAYLRKNADAASDAFYKSIPGPMHWPMFVLAVLAAIIASQALISGTFCVVQQSLALGCFPHVKVVHTSTKHPGQVYIPEVNYLLMLLCIFVTIGFKTTAKIGNVYGIAVVFVMILTSAFLVIVMLMIWKVHMLFVIGYILVIGTVELTYLSAGLYKFDEGGYLPLAFAMVLMAVMFTWNHVYRKRYHYELEQEISHEIVKKVMQGINIMRVPGLAIFYSEFTHGIPPIFEHYVVNVRTLYSVIIFISFKSLPRSNVPEKERFLFWRVEPRDLHLYRCIVYYGYKDPCNEDEAFERLLVDRLKEFMGEDHYSGSTTMHRSVDEAQNEGEESCYQDVVYDFKDKNGTAQNNVMDDNIKELVDGIVNGQNHVVEREIQLEDENGNAQNNMVEREIEKFKDVVVDAENAAVERDVEVLENAWRSGIVHLVGEHEVLARKGSSIGERMLIDYAYNFLKRNMRQNKLFGITHGRALKVGMVYEL